VPKKSVDAAADSSPSAAHPLALSADLNAIINKDLMNDIEMLSSMLSSIVKRENSRVYDLYTQLRKHGIDRASDPDNTDAFEAMKKLSFDISPHDALGVMRVFSVALNLVNAAEVHHRLRVMRQMEMKASKNNENVGPLPMVEDSVRGSFDIILAEGTSKEEVYEKLISQKVEIVLTAHPTEVNRRTLLRKYRSITETLGTLDRADLLPYERSVAHDSIFRDIAATWGSDEIRRNKPTPQIEAAGGIAVIETVLWDAVPAYLRKLNEQMEASLGKRLPIDVVPIKFASWIGGDRDGNPNVTPKVTKEVVLAQRLRAAKLFLKDMDKLYDELAISSTRSTFSPAMEELAASVKKSRDKLEKYRRVIGHLRTRLLKTIREIESDLNDMQGDAKASIDTLIVTDNPLSSQDFDEVESITKRSHLMTPLKIMYESLVECGFASVADGSLLDTIRRVAAFGVSLVPLDVREESTRHTLALDAVTQYLGIGSYASWNEEAKLNFLQMELSSRRPLFRLSDLEAHGVDDKILTTLRVFETISTFEPESLGAYVISQSTAASDVLAVMLLQQQFGMTPDNGKMMRVVPLFETLDDLSNAHKIIERLFQVGQYMGAVKGQMEVMVGYSDSAKDAGRLAACWAQYTSQEKMVKVAEKYKIELTFFHGKGGTVGRGGNPALYRAVLSHPPNTINGRFRVTEQGEMIRQNFGSPAIAERTMDIYTAAVLRENFVKHVEPKESWRNQMQRMSDVSCEDYRKVVRDDPRFVPYFRQATPELELGILNIGSRPAKRNPTGGIESLRAIPWTFAWAQTRLNLSAWLGVGSGFNPKDEQDKAELKEMYQQWPWFREIVDLIAMILSKTDYSISENYDKLLVDKTAELIAIGNEVREKLVETRQAVLEVSGSKEFAGPHVQLLRETSKLRNPYVDSINCVQAELLKELRLMGDEESEIKATRKDALIVSINGIAEGMRNSA
jgi:phosphoenolpyruvate carboxylase